MEVVLQGNSPAATTVGILLLTKARQLGYPLNVTLIGDPEDVAAVPGPALVYAPVLASCGVGRKDGSGATVIISGPPGTPLLMTVQPHGTDGWFLVDRGGEGSHPATKAFARLSRDPRQPARHLAKEIRRALEGLGASSHLGVLDVLFSASVSPLTRLSVALRTGRALAGGRGQAITSFVGGSDLPTEDPLPPDPDRNEQMQFLEHDRAHWIFEGLSMTIRDRAEEWLDTARKLAAEDDGRDLDFIYAVTEMVSHLVQLPAHSILPPLGAAEDSVAVGLKAALYAEGDGDANRQLSKVFRFLGGRYSPDGSFDQQVSATKPPADRIARWQWFCAEVRQARLRAEELWPLIIDPLN